MSDSSKFGWDEEDEIVVSQCVRCLHKHLTGATCDAFPMDIPDVIMSNKHDHTKPYPGDNGIQFEPLPEPPNPSEPDA